MLFEAPTPEAYKEKHFVKGVWTTGSKTGYDVLVKYHSGKVKHKTPEQIEKEENIKRKEKWEQEKKG